MQPFGQAVVNQDPNLFHNQNITFHVLENLQRVGDAANVNADELEDKLIEELRDSLLLSQEANKTLQESLVLAGHRIQVLENTLARSDEQRQNATKALQEQINALQMCAKADAEKIASLEASEETNRKTIARQKLICDDPELRAILNF